MRNTPTKITVFVISIIFSQFCNPVEDDTPAEATSSADENSETVTPTTVEASTTSTQSSSAGTTSVIPASTTLLTYYANIKAIVDRTCVPCHSPPYVYTTANEFRLDLYDNTDGTPGLFAKVDRVAARVMDDSMPIGGIAFAISAEEKAQILEWVDRGAPLGDVSTTTPTDSETDSDTSTASSTNTSTSSSTDSEGSTTGAGDDGESDDITFIWPENEEEPSDYSYMLGFSTTENIDLDNATFSIYYTTTEGALTGGTAIAENVEFLSNNTNMSTRETYYNFVTNDFDDDIEFWFYITIVDGSTTHQLSSDGSILIDHFTNTAPSVTVSSPNGGNFFIAGDTVTVSYSGSDSDGDSLTYTVAYSSNGGTSYTTLVSSTSSTSYDWDTSGLSEGIRYRVRVTANDGAGGTKSDTSNSNFGIGATDITYNNTVYTIFAQTGINGCSGGACHDPSGSSKGLFVTTPYNAAVGPANKLSRIQARVIDQSNMPFGGLSDALKEKIQLWLWNNGKE